MFEPSANRTLGRALEAGLLGWALSLAITTHVGAAESLPPSVRACTAETDRERRLDCFDREVARIPDSKTPPQTARTPPAAPPSAPIPSAGSTESAAPAAQTKAKAPAGPIAARLVSIDRAPNEMVLHLDNGEVWEEVQSVAGDLSLKVGDNITIDKRLGSYWLTGPHVSGMKVRQRS